MKLCELINPKVFQRGFEKTKSILGGKYLLVAKHGMLPYSPTKKILTSDQFRIEVYVLPTKVQIGWVNFEIINDNLEAIDLVVDKQYRRLGLATEMYKFAKELGNTIIPSAKQTQMGKDFWSGQKF